MTEHLTTDRLLVCGGRTYDNREAVFAVLDMLKPRCIIQGGARGADSLAVEWADGHPGTVVSWFTADWDRYGNKAGPIRNARMLDEGKPDLVLAFPGGPGTADMVRQAKAKGVPVQEVRRG